MYRSVRQLLDNTFLQETQKLPYFPISEHDLYRLRWVFKFWSDNQKRTQFFGFSTLKIATFYTLPKLHKNVTKPPGRPIVAGIDAETAPLSFFVDFLIRPLAEQNSPPW